jgi:hypothetical protein
MKHDYAELEALRNKLVALRDEDQLGLWKLLSPFFLEMWRAAALPAAFSACRTAAEAGDVAEVKRIIINVENWWDELNHRVEDAQDDLHAKSQSARVH